MAETGEGPNDTHPRNNEERKEFSFFEYDSKWIEEAKGSLMVAATVLASMSFQVAMNPPGGVWQGDKCDMDNGKACREVGTSVLDESSNGTYASLVTSCMISFSASMLIIYLIAAYPIRNKTLMVMFFLTGLALGSTISLFGYAMELVHWNNESIQSKLRICRIIWLLVWVLLCCNILGRFLVSCLKRRSAQHGTRD